jgi:oxygen-dependent protoporphyrinogen oxidase
MSTPRKVVVVGAGPSGLAAAYRLQRAGASVTVYEARAWVGGRTRTEPLDGFLIDTASQLYASVYSRTFALLDEMGERDRLVHTPGLDALWRDGRAREVTFGSVPSMLASSALGVWLKMRLGTTYLPFLTRHAPDLELHRPWLAADAGLDRDSIAAWGAREMSDEFVDSLAYPQLATYYGALPQETSAGFYHQLARLGMDVQLYAMRRGAGELCELLAQRIRAAGGDVHLERPVGSVKPGGGGVVVAGDGWDEQAAAAVVALPAPAARAVIGEPGGRLDGWLSGVRFRPALTVALLLDRPAGVPYFGLSFARGEASVLAALSVQENKEAGLVPPGQGVLMAFVRPESVERLQQVDGPGVYAAIRPDLDLAFPRLHSHVKRVRVYRFDAGSAQFYPGYLAHLGSFWREGVEGSGPIALAGDYLVSPTVEGAVTAGTDAAHRVLAWMDSPSPAAI